MTFASKGADRARGASTDEAVAGAARKPSPPARGAFYSAGPAFGLGAAVQTMPRVGPGDDHYERQAEAAAHQAVAGEPVTTLSVLPGGSPIQRMESEEAEETEEE